MADPQKTTDDQKREHLKKEFDNEVEHLEKDIATFRKELVEEDTRRNIKDVLGKIVDIKEE